MGEFVNENVSKATSVVPCHVDHDKTITDVESSNLWVDLDKSNLHIVDEVFVVEQDVSHHTKMRCTIGSDVTQCRLDSFVQTNLGKLHVVDTDTLRTKSDSGVA